MENNLRPHLTIPDGEVALIENKPTSRSKDLGLDPNVHGSKLSNNLQDILSTYGKIQAGDSLSDEEIRIFQVTMPEGVEIAAKRDFLEKEGMTIHLVKDSRRAIVSSTRDKFINLQRRINSYRNQKATKEFQYIEGFSFYRGEDKQSLSLQTFLAREDVSVTVDIQMMLIPHETAAIQEKAMLRMREKILQAKGTLPCAPYKLSDGTPIIRAKVPVKKVIEIANDTSVFRVASTNFYSTLSAAGLMPAQHTTTLDTSININALPIVAVLDDGISFIKDLDPIIAARWRPTGCSGGNAYHGTKVACKVAFADIGTQLLSTNPLIPRAQIIDCNIRDAAEIAEDVMIHRIREAVLNFHETTKVFNLSSSATCPIEGSEISYLAFELDCLTKQYGVKFILPTGNHALFETQASLQDIIDDTDSRIASPSDAMLNIAVGAIVSKNHVGSLSQAGEIAPFSRIGPGFCGFRKPDLVAFGGTILADRRVPFDDYSVMLAAGGQWCTDSGTSFTAPVVAGDLAEIMGNLAEDNVLVAETLLYHGTEQHWTKTKMTKDEAGFIGHQFGRGLSSPLTSKFSSAHRVTFLRNGTMNKKYKQRVKFYMPQALADIIKKNKAKVTVTCVTQPPVDNTKGEEYLGAYVSASLHKMDTKKKLSTKNPNDADCRKKWDVCYHFEEEFTQFSAGDWEIWLQLYTRWDVQDTDEIPYALAITIEDQTGSKDIYNEVLLETNGRFPVINSTRVRVKT